MQRQGRVCTMVCLVMWWMLGDWHVASQPFAVETSGVCTGSARFDISSVECVACGAGQVPASIRLTLCSSFYSCLLCTHTRSMCHRTVRLILMIVMCYGVVCCVRCGAVCGAGGDQSCECAAGSMRISTSKVETFSCVPCTPPTPVNHTC